MEITEPEVFSAPEQILEEPVEHPGKNSSVRRWLKHWVQQDTVVGSGKCYVLKWITEDALNALPPKRTPLVEVQEPEDEHEVVFLCTYEGCGKIFPEASGVRKHAHVHGEKQFICQYEGCGKRFVDSSKLKRHFLIHTGEKHFMCPFPGCGKAFSLDFNLRSHMRTHTGENYHVCPYEECGKRYAHEYKLKAHVRSFHEKNIPEIPATSPVREVEKEVIIPKYTPPPPAAPPPAPTMDKPFACPFENCTKRYIHEYKLNLHLKNAHHVAEGVDEGFRQSRSGSQGEDDIEEDSDQDVFQEVVPKFYERVPKAADPSSKKRGGSSKPPAKGKLKIITNQPQPSKSAKRKRDSLPPAEKTVKLHVKQNNVPRGGTIRQDLKSEVAGDSEETEDEEPENSEDEDNGQHMGGHMPQNMVMMEDDDEETEDDLD